jgi:diguanylate cyclase (GGDEF)-like protein
MFAWAVALLKNVKGDKANLEELLLVKYPRSCSYCCSLPCDCYSGTKPKLDSDAVRAKYLQESGKQSRSVADFQLMFRRIYEISWGVSGCDRGTEQAYQALNKIYTRMIEEVSEVAEAVRFYHLYPANFDNELADYFAWWFAMASSLHMVGTGPQVNAEELLWSAYPGFCQSCTLSHCDCRPGPVRELLSKPSLSQLRFIDALTQAQNRAAFERDMVAEHANSLATPISCVWIDLDNFKQINDTFDHSVGDEALKHLVNTVRQKIRARDRLYRIGGDEFAVLFPDYSWEEAKGVISRIAESLRKNPLPIGTDAPLAITMSVGISVCGNATDLKEAFHRADQAAIESKRKGRDRITISTPNALEEQEETQ